MKLLVFLTTCSLCAVACATVQNDPGADLDGLAGSTGDGGTVGSGSAPSGGSTNSGGVLGAGATTNTGGASATGGTTSTGGASATGGTTSTGGASATGGTTSTGGAAATGGAATGGTVGTGDCDGVEQFAAGAGTKYAQGAKVVDECQTSVICAGKTGQYEFSCNDQYNCGTQDPGTTNWSTSPWLLSKQCNP